MPPMPSPADDSASARPRRRENHLATGTEVTIPLGAATPDIPMMPNSAMKCQVWLLTLNSSRQPPINTAAMQM